MADRKSIGIFLLGAFVGAAGFVGAQNTFGPKDTMPVKPVLFTDGGRPIMVATRDVPELLARFNAKADIIAKQNGVIRDREATLTNAIIIPLKPGERAKLDQNPERANVLLGVLTAAKNIASGVLDQGEKNGISPGDYDWQLRVKPKGGQLEERTIPSPQQS